MCFSATASFAVSGVLTVMGAVSVARTAHSSHRMFAAVPLVFAAQQIAEGTVWLTMSDDPLSPVHRLAVGAFLAIALVIWPLWLPFSLRSIERTPARRSTLTMLFSSGIAVAAYSAFLLTSLRPVARIAGHSILYEYQGRSDNWRHGLYLLAYIVPTIVPFFVSTVSMARAIGVAMVVSLGVAVLVQRDALTSVWCFFAAVLSGMVLVAVRRDQLAPSPVEHPLPSRP